MKAFKKLFQKIILDLVFLLIKEVKGKDNIPKNGGYVVVSNHASHIDPFTIGSVIFRRRGIITNYIGKKESLDTIIGRFIYNTFDVIPIDRSKSNKQLDKALKVLKNGGIVGIFPEGTRTYDGRINKGKIGVAYLALRSNKEVLPVAIKNTYALWPRHKKFPIIKKIIRLNIGKPISFTNLRNKRNSKKMLRTVTDSIMKKIIQLYSDLR